MMVNVEVKLIFQANIVYQLFGATKFDVMWRRLALVIRLISGEDIFL
jgi:hypothetical protein